MYKEIIQSLRASYSGQSATNRDKSPIQEWKLIERQHFLDLLLEERKETLLEVGAGTGKDSKFFQEHGLQVTCTDLSPAMIELCRQKGLNAYEMDFLSLS